jgi:hypothetical protein
MEQKPCIDPFFASQANNICSCLLSQHTLLYFFKHSFEVYKHTREGEREEMCFLEVLSYLLSNSQLGMACVRQNRERKK